MFVFDSSAFINGSRHHYYLDTMAGVWRLVEESIDDGRVVVPREVYRELLAQDDEITALVRRHEVVIAEPTERVQRRAGELQAMFPKPGLRDLADPFIMAEAEARAFTVVTYEGITVRRRAREEGGRQAPSAVRAGRHRVLHTRASVPRSGPQAVELPAGSAFSHGTGRTGTCAGGRRRRATLSLDNSDRRNSTTVDPRPWLAHDRSGSTTVIAVPLTQCAIGCPHTASF